MAKSLEKVLATFRRTQTIVMKVTASLNSMIARTISVFARRK